MLLLGVTAAVSATDVAIQKKCFGSGTTPLQVLNGRIKIIDKECQWNKNQAKSQKGGFVGLFIRSIRC